MDKIVWDTMEFWGKLVLQLMKGAESDEMLGKVYNDLSGSDLLHVVNDKYGQFVYSRELKLFWTYKTVWTKDLPSMKFGLDANGVVVPGTLAVETTIESYYTLCKRAPRGARAKVLEYYGEKPGK